MLARLLQNIQKPGALKLTLAIAAAAWGATTVASIVQEKTELAEAADQHYARRMQELAELDAMIGKAENRVTALRQELQANARAAQADTAAPTGENID